MLKYGRVKLLTVIIAIAFFLSVPAAFGQESIYSITMAAESGTLCAGGDELTINARLFENGLPYSGYPVRIYFSSTEPAFADVDREEAYTDANGNVSFRIKTKDIPGTTVITAHYFSVNRKVLAESGLTIEVKALGSVSGVISDSNGSPISGARVSLLKNGELVKISFNPQKSGEVIGSAPGAYVFEGVKYGEYTVMAEKEGVSANETVTVVPGTNKANIIMSDYLEPTPTPTPTPLPPEAASTFPGNMLMPLVSCGLGILIVFSVIIVVTLIFKDKK